MVKTDIRETDFNKNKKKMAGNQGGVWGAIHQLLGGRDPFFFFLIYPDSRGFPKKRPRPECGIPCPLGAAFELTGLQTLSAGLKCECVGGNVLWVVNSE